LYEHLSYLPKTFNISLPERLVKAVLKCKQQKEIKQVGVEWAIEQSKELVAAGVPVVHYYTMGRSDNILKIARAVF
jgi:methylenetetrahydrofolate reductase (NADPH)